MVLYGILQDTRLDVCGVRVTSVRHYGDVFRPQKINSGGCRDCRPSHNPDCCQSGDRPQIHLYHGPTRDCTDLLASQKRPLAFRNCLSTVYHGIHEAPTAVFVGGSASRWGSKVGVGEKLDITVGRPGP